MGSRPYGGWGEKDESRIGDEQEGPQNRISTLRLGNKHAVTMSHNQRTSIL